MSTIEIEQLQARVVNLSTRVAAIEDSHVRRQQMACDVPGPEERDKQLGRGLGDKYLARIADLEEQNRLITEAFHKVFKKSKDLEEQVKVLLAAKHEALNQRDCYYARMNELKNENSRLTCANAGIAGITEARDQAFERITKMQEAFERITKMQVEIDEQKKHIESLQKEGDILIKQRDHHCTEKQEAQKRVKKLEEFAKWVATLEVNTIRLIPSEIRLRAIEALK